MVAQLGGKSGKEDIVGAIVALLKWRPMTLAELSRWTNRNSDYIRVQYLKELLRADVIERTNPDHPNDPNQMYRAVSK